MNKIFWIFLVLSVALIFSGCVTIEVTPTFESEFEDICENPPIFKILVERQSGIGSYSSIKAFVIANGTESQLQGPAGGSMWGTYSSPVGIFADGEVKYRYRLEVKRSGNSNYNIIYRPEEDFKVAPVGKISWSSPNAITCPPFIPEGFEHGFNRSIHFEALGFPSGGTETADSQVTISNGYGLPISFSEVYIRSGGLGTSEFSINDSSGNPIVFPVVIPAGESKTFKLSYTDSHTGTGISKDAEIFFNRITPTGSCIFGPVHIKGRIYIDGI